MKFKKNVIGKASEETMNYIQALEYNVMRYQQIISATLAEHPKLDTESFNVYKQEHEQAFYELKLARTKFEQDFIRKHLPESTKLRGWYIDTVTLDVIVEVCEDD